ncbi:MAG: histidine kinase [Candidatus Eisenbacteria bacterium]|uniref:Histidine kinase n=1 Tax=Eiseniibacteriota bacterium TaxID=2212470 RepID=A0A849SLT7_UNCEI|nr:histidine kinase [Candidatus Eisenbacteria bacterium]
MKTRMRVRRALAVAGVLAALLLVGPRILAFTPYPRLGISIDWTQAGFARVSQVYGPPAQGRLKPGDLLTHINGRPVRPPSLARSLDRVTLPTEAITLSGRRDGEIIEVWVPPAQVSVWQRVRFLLLHVSIAVAAPLVAFVVFWRRPDLGTAGVFLWLACLHAVSVVYDYFEYPVTDPTGPFRALMLAVGWLVLWTPAAALHFFAAFPRPRWAPSARWRSPWFWLVVLGYLAPLAFVVALLRTGQKPEGAFRIFEAFAVGVGAVSLLGRYLFTRGLDWVPSRTERVLALTVVAVFTIAGTLNSVLSEPDWVALMQFEVARLLLSLLSIATLLTPFMLAYLIALDPVFDPRRIVQKGIPYALLSGVLAALYLLIVLGGQRLFAEITGEQTLVLNVVAALVLAFAFAPFRERIQRWLDRLFRRDPIALRAALDGAGRHLLGAVHSEEVRRAVEDGIARGLDQRARVEWPVGAPPRLAAPEELPDHARAAVDNLLAQAGIRLESLALQAQRTAAERRAVELREAATRAELRALHAQVQPHFLFNALNALSYLTETDPPAAQRFTERLADMLRYTVEASTRSASLLSDEIGFVEDYLGIARERYDGDIAFEYRGSRELLSAAVPPLLLQPLVENSLKHGYAVDRPTLHMRLDAQREDGWLTLTFADDGRPSTNGDHRVRIGTGVGLDNLDQRVRRFGGAGASLAALPGDAGGFVVTVRWREAPEGGTR